MKPGDLPIWADWKLWLGCRSAAWLPRLMLRPVWMMLCAWCLTGVNDPLEGVTLPEGLTPLEPKELELALGHTLDRCGWSDDWLIEFNHASAQQLLALRVRGTVPPLEITMAAASGLIPTRVLLVVEEKAQLELLQVFSARGEAAQ